MIDKIRKVLLFLFFCSITILSAHAQQKVFSDMDVFHLEWAQDPQISPDGSQIVYRRRGMDKMTDRRTSRLWLINRDGASLIFSANRHEDWAYNRRNSEIYSVSVSDGTITSLTDRGGPDYGPALSTNGQTVAYLGYDDQVQTYQVNHLYTMNPDGSGKKKIETGLDRSISGLYWDEEGDGLYFMYDDEGNTKIGHTDLSGNTALIANNAGGTSIGRPYGGGSFSVSDEGIIALNQTTPNYPAELAVVSPRDKASKISALNSDLLDYRNLGKTEEIWYESSVDGRQIQGWIVKPPAFDPNKNTR